MYMRFHCYSLTNLPPWNARMHTRRWKKAPPSTIVYHRKHRIFSIRFNNRQIPHEIPRVPRWGIWFRFHVDLVARPTDTRKHVGTERGLESSHATRWLSLFARLIALRAAGGREKRLLTMRPREGMQEIMVDRDGGGRGRPPHHGWLMPLLIALPRDLYLIGSWNMYKLCIYFRGERWIVHQNIGDSWEIVEDHCIANSQGTIAGWMVILPLCGQQWLSTLLFSNSF